MILIIFAKSGPCRSAAVLDESIERLRINPPLGGQGANYFIQLQISAFLRFISPSKNILAIFSK